MNLSAEMLQKLARRCLASGESLDELEVNLPVSLDYLTAEFTRDLTADPKEAETDKDVG